MVDNIDNHRNSQSRTYERAKSVVFRKTDGEFGGLSNMAAGFPLAVNGISIHTSEALYQACRFPHKPDIQRVIIEQASPMTAKMKSKPYRHDTRSDWNQVRVKIMRWCLQVKLAQNWDKFSELLLATGDRPIVEESRKDDYWGAKPADEQTLVGRNALGRLLMELRESIKTGNRNSLLHIEPLPIKDFILDGKPIQMVTADLTNRTAQIPLATKRKVPAVTTKMEASQGSLFNQPAMAVTIANLKPYSAYKYSGLPWLGDVPEHWETERAKWLFRKMNRPVRDSDEVVTCFRDGIVTLRKNRRVRGFTESLKEIGYQGIRSGDLVIHAMDAFAGAIGVSDADGKGTPVYSVCEPRPIADSHFYAYILREMARSQWIQALAKGIRERSTDFRFEAFGSQRVPLPPLAEQAAIVHFLDHADRCIRRYIRTKQKLIKLLEEQKQDIIHRAVTRGLYPNVRLKPSGVEWLGDVPEHWEAAIRMKYISSLKGRLGWQGLKASEYTTHGPYVVSSAHFKNHQINWDICLHVTQERYEIDKNIQLTKGDILLMKDGAAMGKLAFVDHLPDVACLNSHLLLFRPLLADGGKTYDPRFMFYFMLTDPFQNYVQVNGTGTTFLGISQESLGNYKICLPPIDEQQEITEFLDNEITTLNKAIAIVEEQIALLREYRTRLIADVVTGKLDMREAASNLPDEIEEPEALEDEEIQNAGEEEGFDVDTAPEEAQV